MPTERVSTLEVRKRLGDLLNRVALRQDQFVIERKGRPLAAMVSVEKLERLQAIARRYVLDVLEAQRPGSLTESAANALADEAKHRTRRSRTRRR